MMRTTHKICNSIISQYKKHAGRFLKKEIENNSAKLQLGIVNKEDQIFIGTISLNNIDQFHRKCEISGFIE